MREIIIHYDLCRKYNDSRNLEQVHVTKEITHDILNIHGYLNYADNGWLHPIKFEYLELNGNRKTRN